MNDLRMLYKHWSELSLEEYERLEPVVRSLVKVAEIAAAVANVPGPHGTDIDRKLSSLDFALDDLDEAAARLSPEKAASK